MTASQAAQAETSFADRMRVEIDRAIQRNLKGFGYLGSPAPAVGQTPKTILHRRGTLSLYHYKPMVKEVYRVPVLLVMAPTNKAFVFDLAPGQSLIEFLLKRGHDVYVMDWNAPTGEERYLKIDNYVLDFIPDCIQQVQKHSGVDEVSLVGYCAGGVLSTIYAALHPDGPLKNLVCFTCPVDTRGMTLFRQWTDARHFDIDRLVDTLGIIPSEMITAGFDMLRPAARITGQIRLWDNLWNDEYVTAFRRMERFGNESLPLPGEYFRQFIKDLMQKNALAEEKLEIGGKRVLISNIKVPLLHIMAQYDHIVPPVCGKPLMEQASSKDKEEIILPGGHVSLIAGANAVKRMWPRLDQWLERRAT
ncbi:poly-beta-hydroxybutyrate polymerase [Camelimonas fluminis]|uniref:PHA/PHB synthase family protein n=1 Tax=Camelimonas fluminis TaxID=1576911 RepID=A0ABV7UIS1_9HYPH|nr:alpha/beta fold hydrolase [Camelimonas fluminis]GHE80344.1 poly-beta-hydroxybutyrate polymerase [Camelimonas fluminis]